MNTVQVVRIMDRDQAIAGLAKLRSEWEDASNGRSLFDIKAYVGFMLIDIANAIGLTVEEQVQALGDLPQHVH